MSFFFIKLKTSVLSDLFYKDPDMGLELWENPSWAGPVAPFPHEKRMFPGPLRL